MPNYKERKYSACTGTKIWTLAHHNHNVSKSTQQQSYFNLYKCERKSWFCFGFGIGFGL